MFSSRSHLGGIVVVGSINTDLTVSLRRLPKPGETITAKSLDYFTGGKVRPTGYTGANQAAAAARLSSVPTQLVGQVGDDAFAPRALESLRGCGVDTTLVSRLRGESTGTALVMLQAGGENSIVVASGANGAEWKITDAATRAVQTAQVVLLQREIPDEVNVIFAKIARAAGVPVVLDCGGEDSPLRSDLIANTSVLSPNETELARLTGMPTDTERGVREAALSLVHAGADKVLVKLGAKGALLIDIYGNEVRQKACRVARVVDTTGAGDTFTAAFAVATVEGIKDADALRFATHAAALCIQSKGAIPSIPTRAQVEADMARA